MGLPTDSILEQVRRSYSGQGGPLTPIRFSTSGDAEIDPTTERANDEGRRRCRGHRLWADAVSRWMERIERPPTHAHTSTSHQDDNCSIPILS